MASPVWKQRGAPRGSCPRIGELRFRRVDAVDLGRRAALDQKLGEDAGAAADIEPARSPGDGSSQSRKSTPTSRLQIPMDCS